MKKLRVVFRFFFKSEESIRSKRYYFKTQGQEPDVDCIEKCMVKNDGTMIGSVVCQRCSHNLESDANDCGCSWIICNKIKRATTQK